MLAHLAERIEALGPRFSLPLQTILAVDQQFGRKRMLSFVEQHPDDALKAAALMFTDIELALKLALGHRATIARHCCNDVCAYRHCRAFPHQHLQRQQLLGRRPGCRQHSKDC